MPLDTLVSPRLNLTWVQNTSQNEYKLNLYLTNNSRKGYYSLKYSYVYHSLLESQINLRIILHWNTLLVYRV